MVVNLYLSNFILNVRHQTLKIFQAICYIQSYVFLKFAILGIPNITILIFTCQQSQTGLINGCELENANCNSSTTIEPKYTGECKRCPACMPNPMFMVPVCGEGIS